jgi:hypothetical protein
MALRMSSSPDGDQEEVNKTGLAVSGRPPAMNECRQISLWNRKIKTEWYSSYYTRSFYVLQDIDHKVRNNSLILIQNTFKIYLPLP